MSIVKINIDEATVRGLTSLCAARGMLPAELVAEILTRYVGAHASIQHGSHAPEPGVAPPDSMDALIGKYAGDRVNDINDVVYGRQDARVGSRDVDPIGDIDEVIYGR